MSFQPAQGQQAEVTYNWRNETDIRGFGGQGASNSFETAENVQQPRRLAPGQVADRAARSFLNEAYLSYQRYRWNPKPENPDIIGENFEGLLRIGGRDTEQFIVQQRVSVRDDLTRFLKWHGSHTAKVGGIVSFVDYDVQQAVQRQSAVHLSRRHQLGLSGERQLRQRRSEPQRAGTTSSASSRRTTGRSRRG